MVGGGPAGSSAAIAAARAGARVMLLERDSLPVARPGESLHPGVELLLENLGADKALAAATLARYPGHCSISAGGRGQFLPFGSDERGAWLGFQAERRLLDAGLRQAAGQAGARVRSGTAVTDLTRDSKDRVTGVLTSEGKELRARIVIDAAGGRHWIARKLGIGVRRLSPRYVATFGYARLDLPESHRKLPADPEFRHDRNGWTWIAPLGGRLWHWTRLSFAGRRMPPRWMPERLAHLTPCGPSRGADVTWRILRSAAGPGWLAVGDAAAVLDPAASHGVLRAIYGGAMAGRVAAEACARHGREPERFSGYDAWLQAGILGDARHLKRAYEISSERDRSAVRATSYFGTTSTRSPGTRRK